VFDRLATGAHVHSKSAFRIAMVDPHDAALHGGCTGSECTRLPVQNPFAAEIRPHNGGF
jgi:hypothetical protein